MNYLDVNTYHTRTRNVCTEWIDVLLYNIRCCRVTHDTKPLAHEV